MKKSTLLFSLIALSSLCLTACGSKTYNMSFEDALNTASESKRKDLILDSDNYQQTFDFNTKIDNQDGVNGKLNFAIDSKQSLSQAQGEASISFNFNLGSGDNTSYADGALELKVLPDIMYINLNSLNLSGGESSDISLISSFIEGFKNQRYSIPTSGMVEATNSLSDYLKSFKNSDEDNLALYVNEGSTTYEGKYTDYQGYNARKFSLDPEETNKLLSQYSELLNNNETDIDNLYTENNEIENEDTEKNEAPSDDKENLSGTNSENAIEKNITKVNSNESTDTPSIENFEGYLVITGKHKVAVIIENMDIVIDNTPMNITFASGEYGIEGLLSSEGETIISLSVKKQRSNYSLDFEIPQSIKVTGTVSPKISKSNINFKFDIILETISEYISESGESISIPMNGFRRFSQLSELSVEAPESSTDLSELLGSYLGGYGNEYEDYNENFSLEDIDSSSNDEDIYTGELTE